MRCAIVFLYPPPRNGSHTSYEMRIARKDAEVKRREAEIKAQLAATEKDRQAIDQQVVETLE